MQLQEVFDLYPLHKRVLGLFEHYIVPRLKDMGLTGSASSIWAAAFLRNSTHRRLRGASLPPRADWWSTLEAIGNWLLIANPLSGDILRLDTLLDDILSRMVDKNHGVNGVEGSSVTLDPPTPSVHANQLAELADPSNQKAACLTFYLGKLAIQLRNAIEHGIDHVVSEGLRVDCGGAWTEIPSLRLQNLKNEAADKKTKPPSQWRLEKELGNLKYVPDSAKALMLTPTSLKRCLVLLSLVLHAGLRQLQLP